MQYVLVTGASTGIGWAITKYFIEQGLNVLASVRKEKDAEKLTDTFSDSVFPLIFDVTDTEAIRKGFEQAVKHIGADPFIGIVNNAGIAINGPLLHIPIEDVEYQLNVNVLGLLRVTQVFFPLLKRKEPELKHQKKIINIGSTSGLFASPFLGPYCASKYAVEAITDSLRRELFIYDHVDASVIEPGPILTPIWEKAKSENDDQYMKTDYAPFMAKKRKMIERSEKNAIHAEKVAQLAYRMLTGATKSHRKVIMRNSMIFNFVRRWMPETIIDRMIRKSLTK